MTHGIQLFHLLFIVCIAKCYAGNDRPPERVVTVGLSPEFAEVGFQHESSDINFCWAATKRSMKTVGCS